ncbi:MAG TPA: type 1 glutamine amidotransferase [Patescibacteria group bacterium]|nr:type 1 glutamine amidotransferase [Patescibacteria group bacterium]
MRTVIHIVDVTDFELPDGTKSFDWFREAFELLGLRERVMLVMHDGVSGDLPDVTDVARVGHGVIVSGSRGPVFEDKSWIPPLLDFIGDAHGRNTWILGVCFGHHALAVALGGEVTLNPRGREMGTVPVYLTPEGERSPLLRGFGSGDPVNIVHRTHVSRMPEGAVRLAFNRVTPTQAFQLGRSFGFQPHPEMTPVHIEQLLHLYGDRLIGEERFLADRDHLNNFITTLRDTPSSRSVLNNFVTLVNG